MIAIDHLTFTYPNRLAPALDDVSWRVEAGELVLLAGPSGSGKSTLLRCLNGLTPHFSGGVLQGQVSVEGVSAPAAGPRLLSRLVGFVSQDPESQSVLDVVEGEIAFALENAGIPPAEMRIRVEEALDLVDLTPLRARSLHTLSGGERQRLAIAAALALRPRILVLDEPTSQLDPQSAEAVLQALVRLNDDLGLTIILAEHRLERIVRYVDRLTYLEDGRIVVDAPVREALSVVGTGPPIVQLGRALNWQPLPLTVKEARPFAQAFAHDSDVVPLSEMTKKPDPLLEVKALSFSYNDKKVLKNVNINVNSGELVALMGRNGAGKTTLLKCVVGLLKPQSGEVKIAGNSTRGRDVAAICREVGYLPQYPDDLLFADSVLDELRVTLRNHNLAELPAKLYQFLDRLGLGKVAGAYPRDLSVGQRQRVAFGAVTVTEPRVLLLDEPTRGLDAATKHALLALWRRWLDDGAAILLVTHDVELAAKIADRTVMLSRAEVIASGPTREVLGSSPHFAPQIARLFPGSGWLTPEDALRGLGHPLFAGAK
jgi:energy-coupling factor transport system ATP-binding protein